MRLFSPAVFELYRQEVRMFLRDRRAVILSIVLPLIVMPLLLFGSHWAEKRREKQLEAATYKYTIVGPEATAVRSLVEQALALKPEEGPDPLARKGTAAFTPVPSENPEKGLTDGSLDFYLDAEPPRNEQPRAKNGKNPSPDADPEETSESVLKGRSQVPVLTIFFRADQDSSMHAARELRSRLLLLRREARLAVLQSRGFQVQQAELLPLKDRDLATREQASGLIIGRFLTLFLLFFLFLGGSAVAIDSIAGEKERGTLETLLTTSVLRRDIIAGKLLLVLSVALLITILQVTNLLVYIGFRVIELPGDLDVSFSPGMAALLLFLYLPVIFLVSSVLLLLSGKAKTYKEAQLYFTPVLFIGLIPAIMPFFPGLKLRSALVLLPVGNIAIGVKELLVGQTDWTMLILAWLVTAGTAVYVVHRLTGTLSQEKLITSSDTDLADLHGGPVLFSRHVLRWFIGFWAIMLAVGVNVESLSSLPRQVLFNVVLIFFGGSLFLIWRYRLNLREALALRPVKAVIWPAVILGAPASLLAAHGVFLLASLLFPVPKELLETFSQYLIPTDYPLWLLFCLIAVIPAIGEEVAFRGVLLYGFRRRFHPLVLPFVVGGVFGFFHMALFRIPATAFLGIILTAVVLMTGSIFPAILWHLMVNATSLFLSRWHKSPDELSAVQIAEAIVVLFLALWVIWMFRTPYPGLKSGNNKKN